MFIPNKKYTTTRNVKDYLCGKVGEVTTSKLIAKAINENVSAVSAALYWLNKENRLQIEYVRSGLKYYRVLKNICDPRKGDDRKRNHKEHTQLKKLPSKVVNGFLYAIDKSIPIPSDAGTPGRQAMYPFTAMKKGDSFLAPIEKRDSIKSSVRQFCLKNSTHKFAVKKVGSKSVRCWRIK